MALCGIAGDQNRDGGLTYATHRIHATRRFPTEIAWVVERSFSWITRYRRLNTIVERTKEHLIAFIEIAFISILSRRLKRLIAQAPSA